MTNPHAATVMRSDVAALELGRDSGCPTCALVLEGLEKCLGAPLAGVRTLRLEYDAMGVPGFDVTVGDGDETRRVSWFVSRGEAGL
jgi:hypothetical protein